MTTPNKITGANAGRLRQLPMRTRWTVTVARFCRSVRIAAAPKVPLLVLLGLFVLPLAALAKRAPAPVVEPVVHKGIRYTVPNDKGTVGYVVAWDTATGRQLWKKTLFRNWICPLLEHDVQWVFITGMRLDVERLVFVTERGKNYSLDLRTRRVKRLK